MQLTKTKEKQLNHISSRYHSFNVFLQLLLTISLAATGSNLQQVPSIFACLHSYALHLQPFTETCHGNFGKCHGHFNCINPKTLSAEQQYHRRKIRESLEIKKAKLNKRRKVLNRNEGNLIKIITWTPLFAKLTEKPTHTYKRFSIASSV